jgi:hypothetical protein
VAVRAADGVFGRIARAFTACFGDDGCALERGFGRPGPRSTDQLVILCKVCLTDRPPGSERGLDQIGHTLQSVDR